jgi:hypothetical protein
MPIELSAAKKLAQAERAYLYLPHRGNAQQLAEAQAAAGVPVTVIVPALPAATREPPAKAQTVDLTPMRDTSKPAMAEKAKV